MRRFRSIARWFLVTCGVVILTSFSIDAALSPDGVSQSALGILARNAVPESECPIGMVSYRVSDRSLCVDQYEASPSSQCEHQTVLSALETRTNFERATCHVTSAVNTYPWTFVTYHQAKELCARSGKRLMTPREWYEAIVGTPDTTKPPVCNVASDKVTKTGEKAECVTAHGVSDGIGNVWEWVDASVVNRAYENNPLPESGYVSEADVAGIARTTSQTPNAPQFYEDYFWSEQDGEFGMIRGGFFGSGTDAGAYSIQAKTPLSFAGNAIGFRCVVDR